MAGRTSFPHLYVALFEAARNGQMERARDLQALVHQVSARLFRVGQHPSAVVKGIKCAVSCLGLCSDFMAEPFHKFRAPERQRIEQAMRELASMHRDLLQPLSEPVSESRPTGPG